MARTRTEIEQELRAKRRERELYVSPGGVATCHAQMNALLDEWEASADDQAATGQAGT